MGFVSFLLLCGLVGGYLFPFAISLVLVWLSIVFAQIQVCIYGVFPGGRGLESERGQDGWRERE